MRHRSKRGQSVWADRCVGQGAVQFGPHDCVSADESDGPSDVAGANAPFVQCARAHKNTPHRAPYPDGPGNQRNVRSAPLTTQQQQRSQQKGAPRTNLRAVERTVQPPALLVLFDEL